MDSTLPGTLGVVIPQYSLLSRRSPFPSHIWTIRPVFQSREMVLDYHTVLKASRKPRIMATHLAQSSPALLLQTPAALLAVSFVTASLTSSSEDGASSGVDQRSLFVAHLLGDAARRVCRVQLLKYSGRRVRCC